MILTAVGGDFRATRLPATVVYSLALRQRLRFSKTLLTIISPVFP